MTDTTKTLGGVLMEALPGIMAQYLDDDEAQRAAEAVAAEVCDPKLYEMARLLVGKWNQHRAVIEAAKEWHLTLKEHTPYTEALRRADALNAAVEALAEPEEQPPIPLDKVKTWEGE